MLECENRKNDNAVKGKKGLSVLKAVLFSLFSAVCALFLVLTLFVALAPSNENTLGFFGYKIFVAEQDIDSANIKGGSLLVVKNTDNDESYTPESLSQNTVLSIEKLGGAIKNNSLWIALCFMAPCGAFFLITIAQELKQKALKREEELFLKRGTVSQTEEIEYVQQ